MKSNKNVLLLIGAFILLGINLGIVNWQDIISEQNLAAGFGVMISLLIISLQFQKIKEQN